MLHRRTGAVTLLQASAADSAKPAAGGFAAIRGAEPMAAVAAAAVAARVRCPDARTAAAAAGVRRGRAEGRRAFERQVAGAAGSNVWCRRRKSSKKRYLHETHSPAQTRSGLSRCLRNAGIVSSHASTPISTRTNTPNERTHQHA